MKQAVLSSKVSITLSFDSLFNFEGLFKNLQEIYGGIAQLGEYLLCKQGVSGSIPLISTKGRLTRSSTKTSGQHMGL